MMELDFTGRRVLVTGGTKGIGKAAALLFAEHGAAVTVTYARDRGWPSRRALRRLAAGIAMGRTGDPVEAAHAIIYLASDHASYATGSLVRIDGGYALAPDGAT